MPLDHPHRIVEAILFLENSLVEERRLCQAVGRNAEDLAKIITEINEEYRRIGNALTIVKLENAWRISIVSDLSDPALEKYGSKKKKITRALLETLAIVAYKQPVTRAEVDDIRGVNCTVYFKTLQDDGLIKIAGKKDAPGKPLLFRTTHKFLEHFGLTSLGELPAIKDIKNFEFLDRAQEGNGEEETALDLENSDADTELLDVDFKEEEQENFTDSDQNNEGYLPDDDLESDKNSPQSGI